MILSTLSPTANFTRHHSISMLSKSEDVEAQKWADKFHFKECHYFCPKKNGKDGNMNRTMTDDTQCCCGELKKFHNQEDLQVYNPNSPVEWRKSHIRAHPGSNAFGRIQFSGDPNSTMKSAKYIRISDDDDIDEVLNFMSKFWSLGEPELPSLCISVIGGAKNFNMLGHKRDVFQQGLTKAALTTGAWIITSGLNLGITRVVGDAVASGRSSHHDRRRVSHELRCIGIAPWGYVLDKERLLNETSPDPKKYVVTDKIGSGEPVSLNSNHTHYIFVDDGIRRKYGGTDAATVKSKIEKKIALPRKPNADEESGLEVPVILIIVEGGQDVFIDCRNSIQQKVPIIICDKTGRAANVLALAAKEANKMKGSYESIKQLLDHGLDEVFRSDSRTQSPEEKEKVKREAIENIREIVKDLSLVTVFDTDVEEDFDSVILGALTKRKDDTIKSKLLQLALTWNRIDMGEKIFKSGTTIEKASLNECMRKALSDDKVDFVRLLLHHGVVMKELLVKQELVNLYNSSRKCEYFELAASYYGDKLVGNVSLEYVAVMLKRMLGRFISEEYQANGTDKQPNEFKKPFKELFLWAVLNFRHQMALFLWEYVPNPIHMALIACKIYASVIEVLPVYNTALIERYCQCKVEFEDLAIGVLEQCGKNDKEGACELVEKYHRNLGGYSSLDLGAAADNQDFVSSVVCQNSLDVRWNKGVVASLWRVVLCIFLPIFIPFDVFMKFDTKLTFVRRFVTFYSSPKTKFCIHVVAYLLFLIFYCYFLLFDMQEDQVTPIEIVVFIYIGALLVDEIREVVASRKESFKDKIKDWWNFTSWNKLDILIILILLVAAFCRFGLLYANRTAYVVGRTFYVVAAVFLFTRVLRLYSAHHALGPKLAMVTKMVNELIFFFLLLAVPLLAYGVTTQSLLYPGRTFSPSVLLQIVYFPYWSMFGTQGLSEANAGGASGCSNGTCPQYHAMVVLDFAVYMMIQKVLLLTLLIAIFTNIFEQVQANSLQIWKYKIHALVVEHERKPILPMPLHILENIYIIISVMARFICQTRVSPNGCQRRVKYSLDTKKEIKMLENQGRATYLRGRERLTHLKFEQQLTTTKIKVENIVKTMEDCQRAFSDIHFHHHHPGKVHAHHHNEKADHPPPVTRHESQLSDLSTGAIESNNRHESDPQLRSHQKMIELYEKDKTKGIDDGTYDFGQFEKRLQDLEKRLESFKERISAGMPRSTSSQGLVHHPPPGYSAAASTSQHLISRLESRLQNMEFYTKNSLKSIDFILRQIFEHSPSTLPQDEPQPQFD